MNKPNILAGSTLVVTVTAAALLVALGSPVILTVVAVVGLLHVGAVVLFISSLASFKTTLRVAYLLLAAGFVLASLAIMQLPVIAALDAWETVWVKNGLLGLPLVLAAVLVYAGARVFARLMNVKGLLVRPWAVLGIGLLAALGVSFLPHVPSDQPEQAFDVSMGVLTLIVVTYYCSTVLLGSIMANTSKRYHAALFWVLLSCLLTALVLTQDLVIQLALPPDHWYTVGFARVLPELLLGMALLLAGHRLSRLGRGMGDDLIGIPDATCVTLLSDTAKLASNFNTVDVILEPMRMITSKNHDSGLLSDEEQRELAKTYLSLEAYLINNEPLQKFSQSELRDIISRRYGNIRNANPVFWAEVMGETVPGQNDGLAPTANDPLPHRTAL